MAEGYRIGVESAAAISGMAMGQYGAAIRSCMFPEIERVLIDEARIKARVCELGAQIARDLQRDLAKSESGPDGEIVLVPILTGAIIFVADLVRQMPLKLRLNVVAVSSYPGRSIESKGAALRGEIPSGLRGKHVLIVDDILDSGRTLALIQRLILEQQPASCRTCVLLTKNVRRDEGIVPDYSGFEIPDAFVVGYGLDYDGHYRNCPEIAILKGHAVKGCEP